MIMMQKTINSKILNLLLSTDFTFSVEELKNNI